MVHEASQKVSGEWSFRVRRGRRGDAPAVRGLVTELGYPEAADGAIVNWIISHPEMELFVAADAQDRAVGLVTLSHRPQLRLGGRIATIDELIVTDRWRRHGVGRDLVRMAVERAKVLGAKRVELVARSSLPSARAFFERLGFAPAECLVLREANSPAS